MPNKDAQEIEVTKVPEFELKEIKSAGEQAFSATKYVASAATIATAVVGIIVFARPDWKPIEGYILSLLTVALNVLLVYITKSEK